VDAPPLAGELGDGVEAGIELRQLAEALARVMSASNSSGSRLLPTTAVLMLWSCFQAAAPWPPARRARARRVEAGRRQRAYGGEQRRP
jgi:hypothetical protein